MPLLTVAAIVALTVVGTVVASAAMLWAISRAFWQADKGTASRWSNYGRGYEFAPSVTLTCALCAKPLDHQLNSRFCTACAQRLALAATIGRAGGGGEGGAALVAPLQPLENRSSSILPGEITYVEATLCPRCRSLHAIDVRPHR